MSIMPTDWSPSSWQSRPAAQQPAYPDPVALQTALARLSRLPPLVTSWEIENLKRQLAEATRGERFLLQGGDCSESFDDCESSAITKKLKILLQMSLVLVHGGAPPRHPRGPLRRPVRQAPLGRHREAGRRHACPAIAVT